MSFPEYSHSLGGQATAKILREQALAKYYANPNYCRHCHKVITPKENQKLREVRIKKFCNQSCAASYNNLKSVSPNKKRQQKTIHSKKCIKCFCEFKTTTRQKICTGCKVDIGLKTKEQLFKDRKSWQSARSDIRKHATRMYFRNTTLPACKVCGYKVTIEIAHIKSVSSFSGDTLVNEINALDNLVALCPNHHTEYDKGLIKI